MAYQNGAIKLIQTRVLHTHTHIVDNSLHTSVLCTMFECSQQCLV